MDLFGDKNADYESRKNIPLAERMRPETLDDFAGQKHLVGIGKPIRIMIEKNEPSSMILLSLISFSSPRFLPV